ncbi:unnamed protein product [Effrenium voratum]|nr:unnamed protein product [Effrenium voratum]
MRGNFFFGAILAHWVLTAGFVCPGNTTADEILQGQDLSGKLALVTGGDSGLGFATALALAKRGAQIVIGNHNQTHGEIAAKNISQLTGATAEALPLNLGSLASVRSFVEMFYQKHPNGLHFLINDAGIGGPSVMTKDGFELVFEVDYLGPFLLTELLLPALRRGRPSRVVNVASGSHETACESAGWPADCFKDFTYLPPPVVPKKTVTVHTKKGAETQNSSSYGVGKWLNIQHAAALAEREAGNGVEACSLTPGFTLTSMTGGVGPDSPLFKEICAAQMHPDPSIPANGCPFSVDEGAAVIAFAATGAIRTLAEVRPAVEASELEFGEEAHGQFGKEQMSL